MQNLNFDEGYKEFCINNDESRVIRFNPSDYGLLNRFSDARKAIIKAVEDLQENIKLRPDGNPLEEFEGAADLVRNLTSMINEQVNYIFNSNVANAAFGNQSPVSTVKGKFLFEQFLDATGPYIEKEIETEQKASQKRMQKYTGQVKGN
jgi:hypothetical protein